MIDENIMLPRIVIFAKENLSRPHVYIEYVLSSLEALMTDLCKDFADLCLPSS